MKLPNFLIFGAAKSGTTALWYFLKQHPDIFMSEKKEARYFAFIDSPMNFKGKRDNVYKSEIIKNFEDYKNLFKDVKEEKAIGEASPIYIYEKQSAKYIKKKLPDVKLIACLRNPADRAFSNYLHMRKDGSENTKDFNKAIMLESKRKKAGYSPRWFYIDRGFYYESLKTYFDLFGKDNIRIYIYDDFKKDGKSVIKDIFRFLDVDDSFEPDSSKIVNESFIPKSRLLYLLLKYRWKYYKYSKKILPRNIRLRIIREMNSLWEKNKLKPSLQDENRKELIEIYREDILKTQQLINKDLSIWLK